MATNRTPKVGEVWRSPSGASAATVTAVGKTYMLYSKDGVEQYHPIDGFVQAWRPPVTPVPDHMPAEVWITAYNGGPGGTAWSSAENALDWAGVGAVRYALDRDTGMVTR